MDLGYGVYCLADRWFYDSTARARDDDVDLPFAMRPVPEGWHRAELEDWLAYSPDGVVLPPQGWKVHVSATLDEAASTLDVVAAHCIARRLPFKFIRSQQLLLLRNAKYADRGASGKFVTIYPTDDNELERVLTELGRLLEGRNGPYILSDLRWGDGPLYVRYGGFAERYCIGPSGDQQLAIADPSGALVADERGPVFAPPDWVALPEFLGPALAARNAATVQDLPYRIDRALHFSNGGGVYGGVDERTGEPVVLKEARPFAGLAMDGTDAVARLEREHAVLERLDGLGVAPAPRGWFAVGDHRFLVEDLVEGTSLSELIVDTHPLTAQTSDELALETYAAWALDIDERVERAVAAIHSRGVVVGDLHPHNVLVGPDGRVTLIDFEVAGDIGDDRRQSLADPAFLAPPGRTGVELDLYALACLRLFLFLPLTALVAVDRDKADDLAAHIATLFPVPGRFLDEAVDVIVGPDRPRATSVRRARACLDAAPPAWPAVRDSMADAIVASATPERDDRLFPGDVSQFDTGGLNLAVGAAGVLYALASTGADRHPEFEDWLVTQASHPKAGSRLGFYDGLLGVAYVLDRLDRPGDAAKVLDLCVNELGRGWRAMGLDLYGGLAGVGLALAHFAATTGDPALTELLDAVVAEVADRLGAADDVATISGGEHPYAGLMRGSSGPALLFIRLYEQTGDETLLDRAATALRQDLRRCFERDDGSLEVNEGWRTMPYLADGSVGIGLVLHEYLAHRDDDELTRDAAAIRLAAEAQFYIEPGLFHGRAGMILYLSRLRPSGPPEPTSVEAAHIRRLGWHAMSYQGHLAFPGEELLRLSMDLATGNAGVLLALGASLHDEPVELPFVRARPRARRGETTARTGRR